MKNLKFSYSLLATLVVAAVGVSSAAAAVLQERQDCDPQYTVHPYVLDFEDIRPPCPFGCPLQTSVNLTSPRGAGLAYKHFEKMERPLLLGNIHVWQGINCTWAGNADKEERFACGESENAIYSPGKSPWNPQIKPRLGSLDFPDTYSVGAVNSLYITPLRLPKGTKTAKLELTGYGLNGKRVTYATNLNTGGTKKRFLVSGLKERGFDNVRALELWLSVGEKGGYEFALDDLSLEEYRPQNPSCTFEPKLLPTHTPGACKPRPTKTTRFTANAVDFPQRTSVPTLYKSVHWESYVDVFNASTMPEWQIKPAPIPRPPRKNFFYTYSAFKLTANTYKQRFGVESIDLACNFPQWEEPDYSLTNGRPCKISFVGRRDPYDGDEYPDLVIANITIPNPVNETSQRFTSVDLGRLTDKPGKFSRLYAFQIIATVGDYNTYQSFVFDNLKFSREHFADDQACRAPGFKELNFDDITVPPGTGRVPVPSPYKSFYFHPSWSITSQSRRPSSPPNSLFAGPSPDPTIYPWYYIESYDTPAKNFLFDLEQLRITLPPDTPPANLEKIKITISVVDACGYSSYQYSDPLTEFIPNMYRREIGGLTSTTYIWAEPVAKVSQLTISVLKLVDAETGEQVTVDFWVDDVRYREWKGPTPGCWRCGRRGGDWCEVPRVSKYGHWL